jgi:xylulokinase
MAMRWLRDNVFALTGADAYERMTAWAVTTPPGAGGLVFIPYLAGERTPHMDSRARGLFLGLAAEHDRGHLTRAVIEGATFALSDAYDVLASLGAAPMRAILAGGGARSRLWRQIVADVFGLPVVPLAEVDGSALGAAIVAGAGVGAFDLAAAARAWAKYEEPVWPDDQARPTYERLRSIFRDAYVKHRSDFVTLDSLSRPS